MFETNIRGVDIEQVVVEDWNVFMNVFLKM